MSKDIGAELLAKIRREFNLVTSKDENAKHIQAILRKVEDETATMEDVSRFTQGVGQRLSEIIRKNVTQDALPDGKMYYNIADTILQGTLRDNYELINLIASQVQKKLDEKLNITIKPQQAEFPKERVHQLVNGVSAPTDDFSTVQRRMISPVENVNYSMYTDYVEKNARVRNDAGINCYIIRDDHSGCCEWCAKRAGKYRYPAEVPKDIYRRHDNCGCTVTFVSDRGMQNVWSKKSWTPSAEERAKMDAKSYGAKVMSQSEAEALQAKKLVGIVSLDNSGESGIINTEEVKRLEQAKKRDHKIFVTDIAIERVNVVKPSDFSYEQALGMQQKHKELLKVSKDRNDSNEVLFIDDLNFKSEVQILGEEFVVSPSKNPFAVSVIQNAERQSLIYLHNHPSTNNFSIGDIDTFICEGSIKAMSVVTNQGEAYVLNKTSAYEYNNARQLMKNVFDSFDDVDEIDNNEFVKRFVKRCKEGGIEYVKSK